MKKIFIVTLTITFTLALRAQSPNQFARESWSEIWSQQDEDESPVDPGWWDQYYMMKKNSEGKIPRLPYEAIMQHEQQTTTRDINLYNIKELGPKNIGGRTRA